MTYQKCLLILPKSFPNHWPCFLYCCSLLPSFEFFLNSPVFQPLSDSGFHPNYLLFFSLNWCKARVIVVQYVELLRCKIRYGWEGKGYFKTPPLHDSFTSFIWINVLFLTAVNPTNAHWEGDLEVYFSSVLGVHCLTKVVKLSTIKYIMNIPPCWRQI